MPWVHFTADYDYRMTKHSVRAYKKGMRMLVSQKCFDAVMARGVAEPIDRPDGAPEEAAAETSAPAARAGRGRSSRSK